MTSGSVAAGAASAGTTSAAAGIGSEGASTASGGAEAAGPVLSLLTRGMLTGIKRRAEDSQTG